MADFRLSKMVVVLAGLIGLGCGSEATPSAVAFTQVGGEPTIVVGCTSFPPNGPIPVDFTGYGVSAIPEVTWVNVPPGVKSYVFMIEDPDAPGSQPFVHWLVTNIDPGTMKLPGSGTVGVNSNGETKYFGPKPPDDKVHHYHFELFALDKTLDPSVNTRETVVPAMTGHVLAKGEVMGTYQKS